MTIPFETVASGAAPTNDSLLLPAADLDGITGITEFGNSAEEDDAKLGAAIFLTVDRIIRSLSSSLGVASARPNPTGAGTNLINQNVSVTWSYVLDKANLTSGVFPATGSSGKEVAMTDVFPGAEVVATTGSATADSVAIALTNLQNYNVDATLANKQGALASDQRDLLETLNRMAYDNVAVRSGTVSSGFTGKNLPNGTATAPPTDFFNDTTYSSADANNLAIINQPVSVTVQYRLADDSTYDVNVTTA